MNEKPRKKLNLRKSTLKNLSNDELMIPRGGAVDLEHVTRAFTDCEFCGNTNAPGKCKYTNQCTYTCTFTCTCDPMRCV